MYINLDVLVTDYLVPATMNEVRIWTVSKEHISEKRQSRQAQIVRRIADALSDTKQKAAAAASLHVFR